jgi:hypothetical protein
MAFAFAFFSLAVYVTLINKDMYSDTNLITKMSLFMMLMSLPGVGIQLAELLNPKKKVYKLSCKCPNCRHLIQMDMKEE